MARIYISHSRRDAAELATRLFDRLTAIGHEVFIDTAGIATGQDWRSALTKALAEADVIVALISPSSTTSQWMMSEIGAARAYQQSRADVLLIPVVIGNAELPPTLSDLQALFVTSQEDEAKIVEEITAAVDRAVGMRAAQQVERKELQERIERTAADYIEEALSSLGNREQKYRRIAFGWYAAGFVALIGGLSAALLFTQDALVQFATRADQWPLFAFLSLKSVIVVGLLVACSKYAFTLGKSYMNEALKNSDRVHAISFGKFYLQAYGEKATWVEIKEAFQHWNIAKDSSFSGLDPKVFDPNFVGAAIQLAKAISGRADDKK